VDGRLIAAAAAVLASLALSAPAAAEDEQRPPRAEPAPAAAAAVAAEPGDGSFRPPMLAPAKERARSRRTAPDRPGRGLVRLSAAEAWELTAVAHAARLDWAVLLGVARSDGTGGALAVTRLRPLARELWLGGAEHDPWGATVALAGSGETAERARALWRYYRAVGLASLVDGLSQPALARLVLRDRRVRLSAAARPSLGRADARVLAAIRYLAEAAGRVTVVSVAGRRLEVAGTARALALLPESAGPRRIVRLGAATQADF
jgi:hypothetical protein